MSCYNHYNRAGSVLSCIMSLSCFPAQHTIIGTFVELISEAQMIFDFALNTSIVPSNCEELQLNVS